MKKKAFALPMPRGDGLSKGLKTCDLQISRTTAAALPVAASMIAGGLLVLGPAFAAGPARASEQLPTIVTYEMQRQHEAVRAVRSDPKAFWIRQIVGRIESATLPLGLQRTATVRVGFVVRRDGKIAGKTVDISSGSAAVDGAALALLERAQPFPPMPSAMREAEMTFALPLRFR